MLGTLIRFLGIFAIASVLVPGVAAAQTTITLTAPDTHVTDATIGAGAAASIVENTDRLTTRVSSDVNAVRRALLKFDTEQTIPAGANIASAKLTVYVKAGAGPATRRIGVYPVVTTFQENQATWKVRKSGYSWRTLGGDLGAKLAEFSAPAAGGTAVTVDVTAFVQAQVSAPAGVSRYTRLALVDIDAVDSTSWRSFHSSETTTAGYRPGLAVTYGTGSTAPPGTSSGGPTLKVLDWNLHYGVGTDGKYDLDRIATHMAKLAPDVISLNEVTRKSHYSSTDDQVAIYAQLLKAKTGHTWHYTYRTDNGAATGVGNAVLSRFPIASTSYCQLSARRVAVNAAVYVNGRLINVWSLHADSSSGNSLRLAEMKTLQGCIGSFAEQRIVAGDFNAQASSSEIGIVKTSFYDSWAEAALSSSAAVAVSYPGNTSFGATRNSRIDYIFYSKTANVLALKRTEVFDTRDANGAMPSDHKPLMAWFEVQ